ncbi:MAG: CPBP family intramembrane glutamic endopeptidase [Candidatus Promineifilaceae bacterium]|nr:CPBP family intramembrane glutamic endopeptidase [Candidatus Promineifilaceae bacterium]
MEPGWRGYALPRLTRGRSQLAAGLLLALSIAGWHLPLFSSGVIPWADLLFLLGTVVIFNWVYSRTNHSVFILMIFHAMNNAAGQFFPSLFSGTDAERLALVQGQLYLLGALMVLLGQWRFWTGRVAQRQTVGVLPAAE